MTSPRLVARLAVRWLLVLLVALSSAACQKTKPADQGAAGKKVYYTCSMHPQIHEDAPGKCPICSMDLILVKTAPATPKPALVKSLVQRLNGRGRRRLPVEGKKGLQIEGE